MQYKIAFFIKCNKIVTEHGKVIFNPRHEVFQKWYGAD